MHGSFGERRLPLAGNFRGAGLAQWWERSPSTNVSRVRFPNPASCVGRVCCWFSTLLREVFLRGTPVFPSPQKPTFVNSNSTWIIVKHFIMSPWLGWLRKHSLCLTLNLHLHLHNQLLLTKFAKNFVILNRWRQKCSPLQIIEPLTSKIIEPLTEKTWDDLMSSNKERNGCE